MINKVSPPETRSPEIVVEMGRLGALSDGVYAVVLTLLVFDIRIPEDALAGNLSVTLLELAPKLLIYLISFIVVGGAWGSQQRMLGQIKRGSGVLVWLNLLSLFFVTLIPASAGLLGRFPDAFIAILCFAINVILIQLAALLLWRHASKNRLLDPTLDPRVIGGIDRRLLLSAAAFALSIPVAFLSPLLGYVLWIGLFILIFATDWLSWQQVLQARQAAIPLDGAARGNLHLDYSAGHLQIHAGATKDTLLQGTFGGGLAMQSAHDGDLLTSRLSARERRGLMSLRYPWAWGNANTLDWDLMLNAEIPTALTIEASAGQADLDLSELRLTSIDLKASASSVAISLPAHAGETRVRIEASVSSFEIHVPPGVAAQIRSTEELHTLQVDLNRFPIIRNLHEYRSPDYETAANRVDIELELGVSSAGII
jgi:uncharacterized membrane protein